MQFFVKRKDPYLERLKKFESVHHNTAVNIGTFRMVIMHPAFCIGTYFAKEFLLINQYTTIRT